MEETRVKYEEKKSISRGVVSFVLNVRLKSQKGQLFTDLLPCLAQSRRHLLVSWVAHRPLSAGRVMKSCSETDI